MLLSGIRNKQQQDEYGCLVVCCQMILGYLGIDKDEEWLWKQLRAGSITPFSKVQNLATDLGLVVERSSWQDDLRLFEPYIESGLPVIVAVDADHTAYWPYYRDHAVIVIGFDEAHVFVNDPAQAEAPLAVDIGTFLLAWANRDYEYAVIRLAEDS
ncbi:MAG: C39 family peptidase [Caldilineaceae bacterium]